MKKLSLALTALCFLATVPVFGQQKKVPGILGISQNQHYFEYANGKPFFWLGDTAWDMVGLLKKEEMLRYLNNRHKKGYNVVQVVATGSLDRRMRPDAYGEPVFINDDPAKPNEKHFQLLDWLIREAGKRNIFIGLLPTWGDKVIEVPWVQNEQIIFNDKNAYGYGLFLGRRYRNATNIIWIMGGDKPPLTGAMNCKPLWEAMIKGVKEGVGPGALVTYHPQGEKSTTAFWPGKSPLDFNMLQSGHRAKDLPVWDWVKRDYDHQPVKPIVDGESTYEDHPINWKLENGYFRDDDVRRQMYRSAFSGAAGITYGHQALWQFYDRGREKIAFPDRTWQQALDRPGAFQAGYLKKLMLAEHFEQMKPAQDIIEDHAAEPAAHRVACRSDDRALVYLPQGKTVKLNTAWIKGNRMSYRWLDPRTGKYQPAKIMVKKASAAFSSPTQGRGNDWVLVLRVEKP